MISLRPYQRAANDAILDYWAKGGGNPIADLATGTGKSVVIATLVREVCEAYPDVRVLMLVHVKELVEQNAKAMLRTWPGAPIGINSAGLGRRDKHSRILFASIQSVARESAVTLGPRHLVLVDEAHLVPRSGSGMYLTLIARLREATPDLRVVGFTATPYRLDSGRLDAGEEAIFDETVFSYDIGHGVDDGWLAPLVSRATGQVIDVSNVSRRGGEFVAGALEAAANIDSITQAACDEIVERGADRRSWLAFCSGVDHAFAVRDALRQRSIPTETVTGDTPKGERDNLIRSFRDGRLKCLTNANVLTTGFDSPSLDMIAMLRPTLSTSLYVQMLGRGTRPVYPPGFDENAASVEERLAAIASSSKPNCLVLDFAQNVRRHGPVDAVRVEEKTGKDSEKQEGKVAVDDVRAKACPECQMLSSVRVYVCEYCGFQWERPAPKHDPRADREAAVMSREIVDRWLSVSHVGAYPHHKEGKPPSMRVEYMVGFTTYQEWILVEHGYIPGAKAAKWWRSVIGTEPPRTSAEAIARMTEASIVAIQIRKEGQWWRICRHRVRRTNGVLLDIDEHLNVRPAPLSIVPKDAAE